jgi:ribosomal protein L37E
MHHLNYYHNLTFFQKIRLLLFGKRWRQSTKQCPKCGCTALGEMRSLDLKYCTDCGYWFDWKLNPNQDKLL